MQKKKKSDTFLQQFKVVAVFSHKHNERVVNLLRVYCCVFENFQSIFPKYVSK